MDDLTRKKLDSFSNTISLLDKGYTLKKLPDGKVWVVENLREKVEGAFWKKECNCYIYTWDQAQKVVVPGFHLPSKDEFMELCKALGYDRLKDEEVIKRLAGECNFVYLGSQNNYGNWWSSTQRDTTSAFALYITSPRVYPQDHYAKHSSCAVRLIRD